LKCSQLKKGFVFSFKFVIFIILFLLVFFLLSYRTVPKAPSPCGKELECFSNTYTSKGKIIIDPGHGGDDGGAVSANGDKEKDLCLDYSLFLGDILRSMGYEVILTRDTDLMLETPGAPTKKSGDVTARVKVANNNPEAFFVSIHMNKFPQSKYSGLQVFYSKNHNKSELLANRIQDRVVTDLQPWNNRLPKLSAGDIFVLDRITSPAVLIECGFLSNEKELMLLKSEEYRRQMCFIIAHALDGVSVGQG